MGFLKKKKGNFKNIFNSMTNVIFLRDNFDQNLNISFQMIIFIFKFIAKSTFIWYYKKVSYI